MTTKTPVTTMGSTSVLQSPIAIIAIPRTFCPARERPAGVFEEYLIEESIFFPWLYF
jgi:hypothetical protein